MQTVYKRLSVLAGFVLLLIVLIVNAWITRREVALQYDNQHWAAHSRHILLELSLTEALLANAESAQRGYLYTGKLSYLEPFDAAAASQKIHIDSLTLLTADNPEEHAQIAQLRGVAQEKIAELSQTISLYQAGKIDDAKALVVSDLGLHYTDQIRQIVDQINQQEGSLYTNRLAHYHTSVDRTVTSIYLTTLVAAVGLILLTWFILRQIEQREKFTAELHAQEELYRVTLTSIGDGVIATDAEGRVTFLNPIAEKLTGARFSEIKGRVIHEVFPIFNEVTHKTADNPVHRVLREGIVVGLANHTVLQHVDGTLIPIEDSAAPIRDDRQNLQGVVLVFRDVTHERLSEEVLRKTEKLASAARLSATVAHEINNPLEAIFNLVYVAKMNPDAPPSVIAQLTLAEQELERVAHITRQTLGFYRDSSVAEPIDLAALVDSVLALYSHKFQAKNIHIRRDYQPCPLFRGVPGELKQAFSNLISNAADAVSFEGTITVRLQSIETENSKSIQVTVEDDGPGIPAEHRQRIFEPFFTTKQDVGTGLGLWVTKGIVDRHNGSLEVGFREDNGGGRGAAFIIRLPLDAEPQNIAST